MKKKTLRTIRNTFMHLLLMFNKTKRSHSSTFQFTSRRSLDPIPVFIQSQSLSLSHLLKDSKPVRIQSAAWQSRRRRFVSVECPQRETCFSSALFLSFSLIPRLSTIHRVRLLTRFPWRTAVLWLGRRPASAIFPRLQSVYFTISGRQRPRWFHIPFVTI